MENFATQIYIIHEYAKYIDYKNIIMYIYHTLCNCRTLYILLFWSSKSLALKMN